MFAFCERICTLIYSIAVKIFDLLYLNHQSLLNTKVSIRKKNMRKYVKEIQGRIEFTTEFKAKTAKDVRQRMDQVMADRGEGLVMKQPASAYVLNGRNNDWIKAGILRSKLLVIVNSISRSNQNTW